MFVKRKSILILAGLGTPVALGSALPGAYGPSVEERALADWTYQGCWAAVSGTVQSGRGASYVDPESMLTPSACASFCSGKGFTAAGVSNSTRCYCWDFGNIGAKTIEPVYESECKGRQEGGHVTLLVEPQALDDSQKCWDMYYPPGRRSFLDMRQGFRPGLGRRCPICPQCRTCPRPPCKGRPPHTQYPTYWTTTKKVC